MRTYEHSTKAMGLQLRLLPRYHHGSFVGLALLTCVLFISAAAKAEPYMAVRYGYKCSQCHLNPTGGGKRNSFGTIFSQTELPSKVISSEDITTFLNLGKKLTSTSENDEDKSDTDGVWSALSDVSPDSTFYSGYLTNFLSVGSDFRFSNKSNFQSNGDSSNTFDLTEGNLYGSFELFNGALLAYFDEMVAPGGASSREAFGLLHGPWSSYLKAGRMMLPFGIRLQDDAAFIREITGFNYGVQDLGVEFGMDPGPFSISMAASNGTQGSSDDNKDKQYTGIASFIQRYWRIGTQATWNNTPIANRLAFGGFAGLNFGRFTLLGEIDSIIDELDAMTGEETERKLLVYGEVNYHLMKGVNLKFTYDFADPNTSESKNSFIRLGTGVQYFPTQFVQLRAFYRFRDEAEKSRLADESEILFEIHLFF